MMKYFTVRDCENQPHVILDLEKHHLHEVLHLWARGFEVIQGQTNKSEGRQKCQVNDECSALELN